MRLQVDILRVKRHSTSPSGRELWAEAEALEAPTILRRQPQTPLRHRLPRAWQMLHLAKMPTSRPAEGAEEALAQPPRLPRRTQALPSWALRSGLPRKGGGRVRAEQGGVLLKRQTGSLGAKGLPGGGDGALGQVVGRLRRLVSC